MNIAAGEVSFAVFTFGPTRMACAFMKKAAGLKIQRPTGLKIYEMKTAPIATLDLGVSDVESKSANLRNSIGCCEVNTSSSVHFVTRPGEFNSER